MMQYLAMSQIRLESIRKTFALGRGTPFTALNGLDLTVDRGTFVSLVGPSGCGKSTLLNLIAGFDFPDEGSVTVDGRPVSGPGPGRVVVFQEPALFPWLSLVDNVAFGLRQRKVPRDRRLARAREQLQAVHLGRFADRFPHELSGGMKQRAAIARALALDPDILLMDEPFGALDEQTKFVLQKDLEELWLRSGKTVVFVTHNIREALVLSDRVVVMGTLPGRIKREVTVSSPRPRNATDPDLVRLESIIMEDLAEELEKVLQQELDFEYHLAKDSLPHPARHSVGSGI